KGFEFVKGDVTINGDKVSASAVKFDENELEIEITDGSATGLASKEEWVISGLEIEATTAKEGDVATVTVSFADADSVKVEVATVVDFKVVMSVDEDDDVPVYYSGVNANNDGLTVDDDHESLEVTIKETFPGAWSMHKDFTLSLPEGVWVTAVDAEDENGTLKVTGKTLNDVFEDAYIEGDHVNFEFEKRTFDETEADGVAPMNKEHEMTFVLTLVADPGFVGDVVLTMEGDAVDTQEVTIAKFVSPYTVKAEQNDLKIDYRYTAVDTEIVVTEAEAGLWAKDLEIGFVVDRGDMVQFEDDATFTVNEDSDMEFEDFTEAKIGMMGFVVEEESDEVAAEVTISDIELFMQRNIPAGPYDLELYYGLNVAEWKDVTDEDGETVKKLVKDFVVYDAQQLLGQDVCDHKDCDTETVDDVCDYSDVVKEGWINVVTAGREADDASFTTKVVVPVGESYIVAGETQVALDVPAYVNAAGYTMLPVRAVAVALGINTQNVLWDQATKTVTILYGQRIITMQVGAKVVYVNGSAIPASASVEIVDGRTFLPMRDLATALGVTDITWDAATKTATLNGNV
ncbi:MAG: copper amine oxidase N-terminal domain-containing protein, partial [Anaerotignum sp.]|nr:copper amine oxidase N-terminal domain-containing protein [Anaerotignum sp.]